MPSRATGITATRTRDILRRFLPVAWTLLGIVVLLGILYAAAAIIRTPLMSRIANFLALLFLGASISSLGYIFISFGADASGAIVAEFPYLLRLPMRIVLVLSGAEFCASGIEIVVAELSGHPMPELLVWRILWWLVSLLPHG